MDEPFHWVNSLPSQERTGKNYRQVKHVFSFRNCYKNAEYFDPLGIAATDEFLCLTDPMLNAVRIYNCNDSSFAQLSTGNKEPNEIQCIDPIDVRQLMSVFDVAIHKPSKTMLVTDPVGKCIHCLTANEQLNTSLFNDTIKLPESSTLAGLCVTPSGQIFVADSESGILLLCDETGKTPTKIGREGTSDGEFCYPQFLCYDERNDHVIVSDTANSRVQVLTPDGRFLFKFGCYGDGKECLVYPSGVGCDEYGRIFVVDQGLHNIRVFDNNGTLLHTIGGPGVHSGYFRSPKGLTILPNGDLFVTDSLNSRVQCFS